MDESCFALGAEILDSPDYGEWSRWAVYSRINRRRTKALKSGDQAFLQRCERFYRVFPRRKHNSQWYVYPCQ